MIFWNIISALLEYWDADRHITVERVGVTQVHMILTAGVLKDALVTETGEINGEEMWERLTGFLGESSADGRTVQC